MSWNDVSSLIFSSVLTLSGERLHVRSKRQWVNIKRSSSRHRETRHQKGNQKLIIDQYMEPSWADTSDTSVKTQRWQPTEDQACSVIIKLPHGNCQWQWLLKIDLIIYQYITQLGKFSTISPVSWLLTISWLLNSQRQIDSKVEISTKIYWWTKDVTSYHRWRFRKAGWILKKCYAYP